MSAEQTPNNRIICVDDEKDIVQAYVDFLAPAPVTTPKKSSRAAAAEGLAPAVVSDDYIILKAHSGEEALKVIKEAHAAGRPIAAGFFDVKMDGGIDGIQAIQLAWQVDPDLHCTIVTAYQDRSVQDINQLFGERFKDQWDYMNKPFTQGEIVQKARQMTGAWNRRRNLQNAMDRLKAAQVQLVQSERLAAIGQVARGVGHEFGNILQRMVGKADLSLTETDAAKVRENIQVILQAAERASVIVRNLQAFSKTTASHGPLELSKIIGEMLSLTNHEFVKASVTLIDKRQACAKVNGNAGELQQVLMNLVINALHAMSSGGTLEIGCGPDAGAVKIWVRDSGTGIAPEVLPKIFDYAFTTKGEKGSGLGLSISKQIVEGHGGTLSVESEVGKGTTFTVRFPGLP